jgi:hypothetical protein
MGCGIPSIVALRPPQFVSTSNVDNQFTIQLTSDNDEPQLRGVELYYKFYSDTATVPSGNLETRSEVLANGFRRFASTQDKPGLLELPLVNVSAGPLTITVTIRDDTSKETSIEPAAAVVSLDGEFRRSVTDTDGEYKSFDDFILGDADLAGVVTVTGVQDVQIALYAACFGRDTFTAVYSPTLYMQSIRVSIDVQNP